MSAETAVTLSQFRERVEGHLREALRRIPDAVPEDVMDPACAPFVNELDALDEYLFSFGQDERVQEMRERERELKTVARQRDRSLEDRLMRLDARAQSATRLLGGDHCMHRILQPAAVALLVSAMVELLDAFPATAFHDPAPGTMLNPPSTAVQSIMRLMYERRSAA